MARRKSTKNRSARRGRPRRKFLWVVLPFLLLLFCAGAAVFSVYMLHLDHEVRSRFEGTRWKLPAKVYAAPLQLYAGLDMSEKTLEGRLDRLGYRKAASIKDPGTYDPDGSTLRVHTRTFQFWDGTEPDRQIRAVFSGDNLTTLTTVGDKNIALMRLDPMLIGSIYPTKGSDRILVQLSNVPKLLPDGLIAVEDKHFRTNWGVSPRGILRAAVADIKAGAIVQGGSTLTQQLVRNFYLSNRQTMKRKIKEALMAILLNANYSKHDILQSYLNEVYLGQEGNQAIRGFGLASYFYFQKPVQELQPNQIALLVAMVKGPSYYDPRVHPQRALARRNLVLDTFHDAGLIDAATWKHAKATSLGVSTDASYGNTQYPDFIDLVRQQLQGEYKQSDLADEGLRIFTTLDPGVQADAEKAVDQQLAREEKAHHMKSDALESAAVVTSVEGGNVLALVGGRQQGYAGFNRALDAKRQVGSVMKPVDYLTAMEEPGKFSAITPLNDMPLTVKLSNGKTWSPTNFSNRNHGPNVPAYYAIQNSFNIASSRLALSVGIPKIAHTLHQLGYRGQVPEVPSLALGSISLSPFEVAQIYNTIATGGYYTPLRAIKDVTTRDGKPLNRYPLKVNQVINPGPIYITQWMMERVARYGTGAWMYRTLAKNKIMAGKTGTTNSYRDAWFAGFGANRLAVVWVGRDDDKSTGLTGATGALPIWSQIMSSINVQGIDNTPPPSIVQIPLQIIFNPNEPNQGAGPNPMALFNDGQNCPNATPVPFINGFVPQGLLACDTDIMRLNQMANQSSASQNSNNQQQQGNIFQKIF